MKDILNIAICDDEPVILDQIAKLIKNKFEKQKVKVKISIFNKGEDIVKNINNNNFDVVFLDIELKTENGVEIAKKLRNSSYKNLIVFITSFMDYALDGYKTDAFRFILKSNIEIQLSECISAISETLRSNKYQIKDEIFDVNDILYVVSDNRIITIYFRNGRTRTEYMKLDDFEKKVNSKKLCRIHQSYLINIEDVEFVTRYEVTLKNNITLPISKSRYKLANKEIKLRSKLWT